MYKCGCPGSVFWIFPISFAVLKVEGFRILTFDLYRTKLIDFYVYAAHTYISSELKAQETIEDHSRNNKCIMCLKKNY